MPRSARLPGRHLLGARLHDPAQRRVARLTEDLRTHHHGRRRRLQHVVAGGREAMDTDGAVGRLDLRRVREVRQAESRRDRRARPRRPARRTCRRRRRRGRTRASSARRRGRRRWRGCPSRRVRRRRRGRPASRPSPVPCGCASSAGAGPIVSSVTSPPSASVSLSAVSSVYSSLPLASSCCALRAPRVVETLGPDDGHGLQQDDDVQVGSSWVP